MTTDKEDLLTMLKSVNPDCDFPSQWICLMDSEFIKLIDRAKQQERARILNIATDNAFCASFQTMSQYRGALINAIRERGKS